MTISDRLPGRNKRLRLANANEGQPSTSSQDNMTLAASPFGLQRNSGPLQQLRCRNTVTNADFQARANANNLDMSSDRWSSELSDSFNNTNRLKDMHWI